MSRFFPLLPVRKEYEWTLTPAAEWIHGKDRILELYVNVVELGPGVEAATHHYGIASATCLGSNPWAIRRTWGGTQTSSIGDEADGLVVATMSART